MDARINDAPLSNVQQFTVIEEHSSPSYRFDIEGFNRLVDSAKKNHPLFKGVSDSRFAEICMVSDTTFKDLRKGRNSKPRTDTMYSILAPIGGSMDRLFGLAPTRDIAHESAVWDDTIVDGLQQRIDYLTQQKADDDAELARLRKMVLVAETAQARAEEHAAGLDIRLAELNSDATRHRIELRRHRWAMLAVTVLLIAVLAYVTWEFANPQSGLLTIR